MCASVHLAPLEKFRRLRECIFEASLCTPSVGVRLVQAWGVPANQNISKASQRRSPAGEMQVSRYFYIQPHCYWAGASPNRIPA